MDNNYFSRMYGDNQTPVSPTPISGTSPTALPTAQPTQIAQMTIVPANSTINDKKSAIPTQTLLVEKETLQAEVVTINQNNQNSLLASYQTKTPVDTGASQNNLMYLQITATVLGVILVIALAFTIVSYFKNKRYY